MVIKRNLKNMKRIVPGTYPSQNSFIYLYFLTLRRFCFDSSESLVCRVRRLYLCIEEYMHTCMYVTIIKEKEAMNLKENSGVGIPGKVLRGEGEGGYDVIMI